MDKSLYDLLIDKINDRKNEKCSSEDRDRYNEFLEFFRSREITNVQSTRTDEVHVFEDYIKLFDSSPSANLRVTKRDLETEKKVKMAPSQSLWRAPSDRVSSNQQDALSWRTKSLGPAKAKRTNNGKY